VKKSYLQNSSYKAAEAAAEASAAEAFAVLLL
jgi:hypothetical protein